MAALDKLLRTLIDRQMQALLLEPGSRPRIRLGGTEQDVSASRLAGPTIHSMLEQVAPKGVIADSPAPDAAEFGYELDGDRFRFSCLRTEDGWSALISRVAQAPQVDEVARSSPRAASGAEREADTAVAAGGVGRAQVASRERRLVTSVDELLRIMLERDAADLHLSSHQQVRLRIDGALEVLEEFEPPLPEWVEQLIDDILPDRARSELESNHDTDFAYELEDRARFRVNVFHDRLGLGAVLRLIPTEIPSFDALDLPPVLAQLARRPKGLVMVTGPTGAGKSTTLAALIDLVNSELEGHIITLEDPIEFVHRSKSCLVHQREIGVHTKSFATGLRAALREDPDVVLAGELRELEAALLAMETAETGHLVFASLHTASARATVERLVDQFPADRRSQIRVLLAESLAAVVSQTLLRRKGGGRVAAHEILVNTPEIARLIHDGATEELPGAIAAGAEHGMQRLDDSLARLVVADLVEPGDALGAALDPAALASRLEAAGVAHDRRAADERTNVKAPAGGSSGRQSRATT
jgi:twitching motility protein PilT